MKVLFFGAGAFGLPTLEMLSRDHELVGVVTQPDRPAGRGRTLTPSPIGARAAGTEPVPVYKPQNVNTPEVRDELRGLGADAWVVIAFGQKLGEKLLDGVFAVNLHASLLPRWRGAAPINAAVLAGDTETGNSVITLADRMDAGLVLGRSRRTIEPKQTAGDLHDLLAQDGAPLVADVLAREANGETVAEEQDEALVTLAGKMSKDDGWVDFARPANECRNRVHGLTPWPGVSAGFRGERLKLLRVEAVEGRSEQEPGRVADTKEGLVACGEGLLRLVEVQPAGKKPMGWDAFARGARVEEGERFEGRGA